MLHTYNHYKSCVKKGKVKKNQYYYVVEMPPEWTFSSEICNEKICGANCAHFNMV